MPCYKSGWVRFGASHPVFLERRDKDGVPRDVGYYKNGWVRYTARFGLR
jgi:hypothetical protein